MGRFVRVFWVYFWFVFGFLDFDRRMVVPEERNFKEWLEFGVKVVWISVNIVYTVCFS